MNKSDFDNNDLFINNYKNKWEILFQNNLEIFEKIQNQMCINFVRMFVSWGFAVCENIHGLAISLPQL